MQSIIRAALLLALGALTGLFLWLGITGVMEGTRGREIILAFALAPAIALVVRLAKGRLGSVLAVIVAGVSAFVGALLSFCLCPAPLKPESIAILVAAAFVGGLALIDILVGFFGRSPATRDGGSPGA